MDIILYTSHCPKCKVLEVKLQKAKVDYKEVEINQNNIDYLISNGIMSAPCLKVDGEMLEFTKALEFLKTL